jgi:hypothetical protein
MDKFRRDFRKGMMKSILKSHAVDDEGAYAHDLRHMLYKEA